MLSCVCLHEGRPAITNASSATGEELSITNSNEHVLLGMPCNW